MTHVYKLRTVAGKKRFCNLKKQTEQHAAKCLEKMEKKFKQLTEVLKEMTWHKYLEEEQGKVAAKRLEDRMRRE